MLENHREIINPNSVIAFKPRQVLLAKLSMKHNKASSTGPDKKTLLHHAICWYLQNNGFSKTLKKFRSESKLDQDDNWKDVTLDLEEAYYKCLEKRSHTSTSLDGFQEQDLQRNGDARKDGVDNGVTSVETVSKKKKKKSDENDCNAGDSQFQVKDEFNIATNFEEIKTLNLVPEAEVKSKTKKRRNMASVSMKEGAEQASSNVVKPTNDDVSQEQLDEPCTKSKDKKKKKSNSSSETLVDKVDDYPSGQPLMTEGKSKDLVHSEDKSATDSEINIKSRDKKRKKEKLVSDSEDVGTNKEDKRSKKLKRAASEENSPQPVDNLAIEECKKDSEEYKPSKQFKEVNASLGSDRLAEKENKEYNVEVSQERTINQLGAQTDKDLDSNGGKSSVQKSLKKQQNGSAEPKTVNAFQRVKTDKVVFADERLQDNSYWAKDGADVGYGAKAQEILGQVRGRDFRHEKTKKKRGSYRGGQIDLQSHSVKFNYSDDDDED